MKWEGALWVKTLVSNYGFFVVVFVLFCFFVVLFFLFLRLFCLVKCFFMGWMMDDSVLC